MKRGLNDPLLVCSEELWRGTQEETRESSHSVRVKLAGIISRSVQCPVIASHNFAKFLASNEWPGWSWCWWRCIVGLQASKVGRHIQLYCLDTPKYCPKPALSQLNEGSSRLFNVSTRTKTKIAPPVSPQCAGSSRGGVCLPKPCGWIKSSGLVSSHHLLLTQSWAGDVAIAVFCSCVGKNCCDSD